jgi:ABC-type transport system involved in multi-copper enzyme maturation permease subunit
MFDLRLIRAEVLKLRRRRGMLALAAALTVGVVALAYIVTAVQHAGNPAKYGPAGGLKNYRDSLEVIIMLTIVAGAIVGSTAGAQDIESGVFRDLAATGRSRLALFGARVTGAWAIVVPLLAVTMIVTGTLAVALAGSMPAPHAGMLIAGSLSVIAAGALSTAIAVGLSALVGSRGPVIGTMLAFLLALQPLLIAIGFLGFVRELVPAIDIARVGDAPLPNGIHVGLVTAIAAMLAWGAATLALGAWKTASREI